jgi:Ni,Fe-hydrogenase III small subunit
MRSINSFWYLNTAVALDVVQVQPQPAKAANTLSACGPTDDDDRDPTFTLAQGRCAPAAEAVLRIRTVKAADMPAVVALDATVTGCTRRPTGSACTGATVSTARASATSWWPSAMAVSAAS